MATERAIDLPTSAGVFTAHFSGRGLAQLNFPRESGGHPRAESRARAMDEVPRAWRRATENAIRKILAGSAPDELPPLDLSSGTEFQREVWRAMQTIAPGATRTYGEIAAQIGRPQAGRAVGQACGANPIPLLVPCHRVVTAGGRLGGFSGGLEWKRRLLAIEGRAELAL